MRNVFGFLFIYDILKRNISKINYIKVIHVSYKKFESTKKKKKQNQNLAIFWPNNNHCWIFVWLFLVCKVSSPLHFGGKKDPFHSFRWKDPKQLYELFCSMPSWIFPSTILFLIARTLLAQHRLYVTLPFYVSRSSFIWYCLLIKHDPCDTS